MTNLEKDLESRAANMREILKEESDIADAKIILGYLSNGIDPQILALSNSTVKKSWQKFADYLIPLNNAEHQELLLQKFILGGTESDE